MYPENYGPAKAGMLIALLPITKSKGVKMPFIKFIIVILTLALGNSVYAKSSMTQYEAKAAKFLLQKKHQQFSQLSTVLSNPNEICYVKNNLDCIQFVAGSYPSSQQKLEAAKACHSADVECVKYVAGSYPSSEQLIAAAKACGGQ